MSGLMTTGRGLLSCPMDEGGVGLWEIGEWANWKQILNYINFSSSLTKIIYFSHSSENKIKQESTKQKNGVCVSFDVRAPSCSLHMWSRLSKCLGGTFDNTLQGFGLIPGLERDSIAIRVAFCWSGLLAPMAPHIMNAIIKCILQELPMLKTHSYVITFLI